MISSFMPLEKIRNIREKKLYESPTENSHSAWFKLNSAVLKLKLSSQWTIPAHTLTIN